MGIVGLGSIGSWIAKLALGFGMTVAAHSRSKFSVPDVDSISLDELCRNSDVIVSSVSINATTRGLLGRQLLESSKRDAILVNIAGNAVLDEGALLDLLHAGHFHGVGFEEVEDERLLKAPRTLLSPGSAWYTQASLDRNVDMFVGTAEHFLKGTPRFVVNA
jgi:phosphoglycerate dehydrogenase-like enzyme